MHHDSLSPACFSRLLYVPRCVDHLRGRRVLVTTISLSLLLTTALRVAVQESPLLSVTMMGVPGSWSLSGSWATRSPSSTAPQPLVELRGLKPSTGGLLGSGRRSSSVSAGGSGGSGGRSRSQSRGTRL